jgi:hypothetical protein
MLGVYLVQVSLLLIGKQGLGHFLKGPKHDQVGCEFFYIKQSRMGR